jgi:membrane fusion protein, multidrug efflux system
VQVERDLGTAVEITGLSPDERIVANPPDSIADGEEVRVMEAAGEKTEAPAERQGALGPGNRPKSADDVAQTGRDHGE